MQRKAAAICAEHPDDAKAAREAADFLFNTRRGEGNNFAAFRDTAQMPAGLECALFGRMITSDPRAHIEAALYVAHAFTVHRKESESDFFSVVDDLQRTDEDAGAAHLGDMELMAGVFYGYVVVRHAGFGVKPGGLSCCRMTGSGPHVSEQGDRASHAPDCHSVTGSQAGVNRTLHLSHGDRCGPGATQKAASRLRGRCTRYAWVRSCPPWILRCAEHGGSADETRLSKHGAAVWD